MVGLLCMDQSNFYLFTGENAYAMTKEVLRWKQSFISKHGPENLLSMQAKDKSVSDLLDAVSVLPFIAEKRLVILEGLPKIEKEDVQRIVESIHSQTVLVIVEAKPDKRLGVTKEIERVAERKQFPLLNSLQLLEWIRESARTLGTVIGPDAESALLGIVGTDQWMLEMELQKLSAACNGEIGIREVEALAVPSGSQIIWQLTDLIGSKKSAEALLFFARRIERGEDPYGMWTILLSMIRNLTMVFAAVSGGMRDERSIASATGLHFLQVRGMLTLARSMNMESIRSLVCYATEADIQLKSGGYHYSAEHQGEVIALGERVIMMTSPHP